MREWFWCRSKEQYTCEEVCQNNFVKGKCIYLKHGCKVKPKPMSEEAKGRLRAYNRKPGRSPNGARTPDLCEKLKKLGIKKAATMLYLEDQKNGKGKPIRDISENTIRSWIKRGNVPEGYHEAIRVL